jgi:PPOX class probable F420-dependent enzyme
MSLHTTFDRQKYLNLETFRKNGNGVKTPVWFIEDGDALFIRTVANSGKVKRIRNNGQVNIAPCRVDGALVGEWIPAIALEVQDEDVAKKIDGLLDKKYGLMKKIFALVSFLQGRKDTILKIILRKDENER